MNKRGQQMTLGTIIAIVLGIAVLVFLIFGFSTGWNNMWEKITNLGGGAANVDDIVRGCDIACNSKSEYSYCSQKRELNDGTGIQGSQSCSQWAVTDSSFGIKECLGLCPSSNSGPTFEGRATKW